MRQPRYQGSLLLVPRDQEEPGKKVADEAACLEKNDTFFIRQTNRMLSCIRGLLKGNAFREILVRVTSWCLGWVNIESSWAGLPPPLPKNILPWITAKKGYSASYHFYQITSYSLIVFVVYNFCLFRIIFTWIILIFCHNEYRNVQQLLIQLITPQVSKVNYIERKSVHQFVPSVVRVRLLEPGH